MNVVRNINFDKGLWFLSEMAKFMIRDEFILDLGVAANYAWVLEKTGRDKNGAVVGGND